MSEFFVKSVDTPEEELALQRLSMQAFNFGADKWQSIISMIGQENMRVSVADKQIVGGLGFYPEGQWFGGKRVPMAGIALVSVGPEYRGRGYARRMLQNVLQSLRAEGFSTATLYASTQALYRKLGFEQSGNSYDYALSLRDIHVKRSDTAVRRIDPLLERSLLQELANERARLENGCLDRSPGMWERLYRDLGRGEVFTYVFGEPGNERGYIIYDQSASAGRTSPAEQSWPQRTIYIRDMVALDAGAMQSIWAFVASHQPVVEMVKWSAPATDTRNAVTNEFLPQVVRPRRWMLRMLDVRKALLGRGYPAVSEAVSFGVRDETIPENCGVFTLTLNDGRPSIVDENCSAAVRINASAFGPLFSGLWTAEQLQRCGLISGVSVDDLATLSRIFSGSEPWMPDSF